MSSNNLSGFYRGIVVQNNDPQKIGRVKVFIPHLHMSLLDIEESDYDAEFYFGEFGTNYQSKNKKLIDLTKYIEKIKFKLPWAEVCLPITGGGFSSFNSPSNKSTVSDSPHYVNQINEEDGSEGSAAGVEYKENPPADAFAKNSDNPNPLGNSYNTQSFYNAPKGMFGIPQVNSKVWLFFLDGNQNTPVVFGYSPSASSYNQIYDDTNYPSGYENNDPTQEANPENLKRRQLTAMNYKGGSISFNGTDNEESLSISHDSGSYTQFTNSGKQSLVITQDNNLIKGSQYTTVENNHNFSCGNSSNVKISGDLDIQIGTANYAAAQQWKDAAAKIHAVKSLPETQNSSGDSFFSSPLAKKSGENPPCPACSQGRKYKTLTGGNGSDDNKQKIDEGQLSFKDSLIKNIMSFLGIKTELKVDDSKEEQFPKTADCKVCGGSGKSPSTMGGDFPKETRKDEIGNMYLKSAKDFSDASNAMGNGGSVKLNVSKDFFLSVGCASNDLDSIKVNKEGSAHDIGLKLDGEKGVYPSQVVGSVVEMNHVDKFPGGQFTIDAHNGICLQGGSGGMEFASTGITSIYGTIAQLTGEQVIVSSKSGLSVSTEDILTLKAPNIAISADNQTFFKGNVAIDSNIVCRGGAMIQGEMFVQHVTAPMSIQETEHQSELYGTSYPFEPRVVSYLKVGQRMLVNISGLGNVIMTVLPFPVPTYSTDLGQTADDGCVFTYPHNHLFRNLPLSLTTTYEAMRGSASGIDGNEPIESKKIENGLTCPEVKGTTKESNVGLNNQLSSNKFTPINIKS
jgi:hypothetical protein